jgi:hypothetical protein
MHPLIEKVLGNLTHISIEKVPDNNIVVFVPGKRNLPPIALAAHLDKVNHFGSDTRNKLSVYTKTIKNLWDY